MQIESNLHFLLSLVKKDLQKRIQQLKKEFLRRNPAFSNWVWSLPILCWLVFHPFFLWLQMTPWLVTSHDATTSQLCLPPFTHEWTFLHGPTLAASRYHPGLKLAFYKSLPLSSSEKVGSIQMSIHKKNQIWPFKNGTFMAKIENRDHFYIPKNVNPHTVSHTIPQMGKTSHTQLDIIKFRWQMKLQDSK